MTEKLNLLPGGIRGTVPGAGEDDRVEAADPFRNLGGKTTLRTFMSMRHDPMASAVYRQKIGTVDEEGSRRDRETREMSALPMNEYEGGGKS